MIIGAGAVGGTIGGALFIAGHEVVLVARGAHLAAIRARGLTLVTPSVTHVLRVPVVASASELAFSERDVVIVATKSEDTRAALASITDRRVPVVCAQNGVANERVAAERCERVFGAVVFAPLSHVEPGIVSVHSATTFGGLDLGRWPAGTDALAERVAIDLRAAGFDVRVRADIARWKHGKLLSNLGNVLEALGGRAAMRPDWLGAVGAEAEACLRAAGIAHASVADILERFASVREAPGRGGGSTWQSLHRGTPLETRYLNGEICELGRAHGMPTPMNDALVSLADRAMAERWTAGSRSVEEINARLPGAAPSRAPR